MSAKSKQDVAATLMAMERAALDRWSKGDPFGFLEISASDVVYFDPYLDRRIDREELNRHYEALRGKVTNKGYEMIDPKVQKIGNVAVLTYNYVVHELNGDKSGMNVTEVFRNDGDRWKIIHTHLSFTKR
ncbi:MAG: YybH family protein [Pseudonocardiaceae bacterium]